ncbi:aldehyde dehydrogenase (NADP(+)) [Fodinicola acaciae]|uniref:aldehyde dehydrogenase (NADP(+)) n=1 Tax=Fodinicola acaciae TaxID=2681555 RepID=UPI0013D640CA|nr:aldehyde dehydrogenase (NADP(+)) [Fodinicola acaciae]
MSDTTADELEVVMAAAAEAAAPIAAATPKERASWLVAAADALDAAAGELVPLAAEETHLPAAPRLAGELKRTTFQLRLFAGVLDEGGFLAVTIDHADPDWGMGPRPDIRRVLTPIGPVLVFGASNFPFAFSVAGGDTASALAAGCPVVHKGHPGHPRLAARTAEIVATALVGAGAPAGIFGFVTGVDAGVQALRDERITAAAFTGSLTAGRALFDIANSRPTPIPFYGELGSMNPVVVTPEAVARRGKDIAAGYVGSFTLGAGQFCTKPGLLFLPAGHGLESTLVAAVEGVSAQPLLNDKIASGFGSGVEKLREAAEVLYAAPDAESGSYGPTLVATDAATFLASESVLDKECFGPASVVVSYADSAELLRVLETLEPSLTATIQGEADEGDFVRPVLDVLQAKAGRVLWNGWPTGVTVTWAQQHGGPYPATTAPTTTSVGTAAIERFLRPVAYQDVPEQFLPPAVRDDNPWRIPQRVDGKL